MKEEHGSETIEILAIARKLQAIAQSGLFYTRDAFDKERFSELRKLSTDLAAGAYDLPAEKIMACFERHDGPATPLVDVRALILESGRVLLVRDPREEKWSLPGGWAEIGLTPEESIAKEVREETGYEVEIASLLGIEDNLRDNDPRSIFHAYKLFFHCAITGGALRTSIETDAVEFFDLGRLPPLSRHRSTDRQIGRYAAAAKVSA